MRNFKNETGLTLVEVLASLVIISILFTLLGSYFVSSYQQNKIMDNNFRSVQLCQGLLDVYKGTSFEDLKKDIGETISIDIVEQLQLDGSTDISKYSAEVTVTPHPVFEDEVLIVKISVYSDNNRTQTELEGYVKK